MRSSAPARGPRRLLANIRAGRMQRTLSAMVAGAALPVGGEIWLEHYRGSFGDKWMWTPIVLTPPLAAAGVAAVFSERAARTALPIVSALYTLDGLIGVYTHLRGVRRKPGGLQVPLYNLVMGPPLLAPGSLALIGALGLVAPLVPRER
ncbi:MAG: hypothetical protein M3417_13555 [Actinomycetota bacterium]|nr:hypothetical protein [Actinomycetota bacterium]